MKSGVGALSLFALGVNGIVGVGIFFTPSLVAALVPGGAGALVYLATASLLVPIAVTAALLGRALPADGGPYVWAEAAFGARAAYWVGWIAAVTALLSTAAVFAGLRDHFGAALGVPAGPGRAVFAWACLLLLGLIALFGLRPSAFAWDALTLVKLLPLVALLVLFFAVSPAQSSPASSSASGGFQRALLVSVFSLQGFEAVPVLAGSARRARFVMPFATVGSLTFAALLYVAIHWVAVRALPDLARQDMPLVATASVLAGPSWGSIVAFATNLSALGTAFGMVVVTPRYLSALGTDAGLGGWLGRLDARGVPRAALALTVLGSGLLIASQRLGSLFALSSAAVLLQYLVAILALLRLALARRLGLSRLEALPAALGVFAILLLAQSVEAGELRLLVGLLGAGALLALVRRLTRRRHAA